MMRSAGTERYLTRFLRRTDYTGLSWLFPTQKHKQRTGKMRASKPRRIYAPRIISDHVMVQEDFERLHKFLIETECLSEVSEDMRKLVEEEWPELVEKLPPKVSQSRSY
jgi:hypothetical protein